MRRIITFLLISCSWMAQAQLQTPQPSPSATLSNKIGLTDVKIEYYRPKLKGRKIFGAGPEYLVPFGKMWRTAANSGSVVTFSDDVKFAGADVSKGSYLLLTIPGKTDWTVILYKDVAMGGNLDVYDQAKDQVRVTVKSEKLTEKVESFTLQITDASDDGKTANLQISWENTSVKIPILVEFDARVMKSIEASTTVSPGVYYQSAIYYLENGKDLKQALAWINIAAEKNPKAYWILYQKARIQHALNDKAGALATSKIALEEATKAKNADYIKMNQELQKSLK